MNRFGLLGRKLSHSYSPRIHQLLYPYSYSLFEKEPWELDSFFKARDFDGINVTIPYKKNVIPYCDKVSNISQRIGSVNTIVNKNGKLSGYNTDYHGFLYMVRGSHVSAENKKIIILGSGGAALPVKAVFEDLNAGEIIIISRTGKNNYENISLHFDADIIVNTTPLGMYPDCGVSPVNLERFKSCIYVFDIIYNPSKTRLLIDAERLGIPHMNGLPMLVQQARCSAQLFTGKKISESKTKEIIGLVDRDMQNIVLIGMPGCGKTAIGRQLAKMCGKTFVDLDEEIEKSKNKSISSIFAKGGEELFRTLETDIVRAFGKQSGLVISTGGGCVTKKENYDHLHQNGKIFWVKRDIDRLPKNDRPISQSTDLSELYKKREKLYESFSDFVIENNGEIYDAAAKIKEVYDEIYSN